MKRIMRRVLLIPIVMSVFSSCATQAQLVDMENTILMLRHQQEILSGELDKIKYSRKVEGEQEDVSREQENVDLLGVLGRIDNLDAEIRNNAGLWEESNNLISELSLRLDNVYGQLDEVGGRLQVVEAGLVSLEKADNSVDSGAVNLVEGAAGQDRMVIPGRIHSGGMTSIEAYNLAYRDYTRGNYEMAIQGFESFIENFPGSSLAHQAQYWIGDAFYAKKEYQKAVSTFEKLIALYPDSDKIVSALLKESFALLEMGDVVKSREYLKQIIERYPYAKEAKLAKEKLSELR